MNILFLSVVFSISVYQLWHRYTHQVTYQWLPLMIATSCLVLNPQPVLDGTLVLITIVTAIGYIAYLIDFFMLTLFSRRA